MSDPLPQRKKENQPRYEIQPKGTLQQKESKFQFQNPRKGPDSHSSDKVLNLYGNQSRERSQGVAVNTSEGNGVIQKTFQNYTSNEVKQSYQQGEEENSRINRQPLFSAGGKISVFLNYYEK